MSYGMYLITSEQQTLQIPVLPEKLTVRSAGKNRVETVLGLGEVLMLEKQGLRSVSWEGIFPAHSEPYFDANITSPLALVRAIENQRTLMLPVRFLLLGTDLDVNMQMGIDAFSYEERGGEPEDIYYSITLKQWRQGGVKTLRIEGDTAMQELGLTSERAAEQSYTVVRGDCLWSIARRFYGDGGRWKDIYARNKAVVGSNPNLIYAGQVLVLP